MFPSLLVAFAAPAQATDVLVLHSDPYFSGDVVAKLVGDGRLGVVDEFDARYATPAVGLLAQYDAVLVYTNGPFLDTDLVGNLLASYVDGGAGVVENLFAMQDGLAPLLGRFHTDGYDPLFSANLTSGDKVFLDIINPAHPVMSGVNVLSGGSDSYHVTGVTLSSTATLLGKWDDGARAVAVDDTHAGRTVGLNFFPASSDALAGLWDPATDGAVLMVNALLWAANLDLDLDSIEDDQDNCVSVVNLDQIDTDGDKLGDACDQCDAPDPDADVDGICDDADQCAGFDDWQDPDADGVPTGCDICPLDAPDDLDGDGVCTTADLCAGTPNVDADGDGICDSGDVCRGEDDTLDADADGTADGCDCLPDEAAAYPGGTEVCDGLDNDCDGEIDPVGSSGGATFYLDLDGDGYGSISDTAAEHCVPPLNYIAVGGDCDDNSRDVNPAAGEFCDGIDNDCDGTTDPGCEDGGGDGEGNDATTFCGCNGAAAPTSGVGLLGLVALIGRRRRS